MKQSEVLAVSNCGEGLIFYIAKHPMNNTGIIQVGKIKYEVIGEGHSNTSGVFELIVTPLGKVCYNCKHWANPDFCTKGIHADEFNGTAECQLWMVNHSIMISHDDIYTKFYFGCIEHSSSDKLDNIDS